MYNNGILKPLISDRVYMIKKDLKCDRGVFEIGSYVFVEQWDINEEKHLIQYRLKDQNDTDFVTVNYSDLTALKDFAGKFVLDVELSENYAIFKKDLKADYKTAHRKYITCHVLGVVLSILFLGGSIFTLWAQKGLNWTGWTNFLVTVIGFALFAVSFLGVLLLDPIFELEENLDFACKKRFNDKVKNMLTAANIKSDEIRSVKKNLDNVIS